MISPSGKSAVPQLKSRIFENGKFVETAQIVTELTEQDIINRKVSLQGRQAQLRQQMEFIKADYDNMTQAILDCDAMLAEFGATTELPTL